MKRPEECYELQCKITQILFAVRAATPKGQEESGPVGSALMAVEQAKYALDRMEILIDAIEEPQP